ncbi:hypothetical protein [Flavimarina sp. Hel_I_48]|uniref:hypothetical protein n=1 Tax=Flavimarina sp. Hel_I_48 TaxID=1392488 RepID=UPI0013DBDC4D|nr:hypothetical protein [Flavimarina sp. Hel_I_48]
MKTVDNIANKNRPLVVIDENLNKLRDKIRFPKKLEKANKMLETGKLPDKK